MLLVDKIQVSQPVPGRFLWVLILGLSLVFSVDESCDFRSGELLTLTDFGSNASGMFIHFAEAESQLNGTKLWDNPEYFNLIQLKSRTISCLCIWVASGPLPF